MKNKIYIVLLLALFGWTCSDQKEIKPDIPKYEVSFSISGVAGAPSSLDKQQSLRASSVFDEVVNVNLFVYNSKGYLVGEYTRQRGMNSSVFVTSMEEGRYTAVAVGFGGASFDNVERLSTARIYKYYPGQVFVDKVEFAVGASETGTVDLTLQRKVGMLDLDITDKPGNDIMYINVKMDDMAYEFTFRDLLPVGNKRQLNFINYPHVENYTEFPAYFFVPGNSQSYKTTITLELISIYSEVVKTIVLKDVTVGVNRKTTIRGTLYNSGPQDFTVDIDDEWSGEDTVDF